MSHFEIRKDFLELNQYIYAFLESNQDQLSLFHENLSAQISHLLAKQTLVNMKCLCEILSRHWQSQEKEEKKKLRTKYFH